MSADVKYVLEARDLRIAVDEEDNNYNGSGIYNLHA